MQATVRKRILNLWSLLGNMPFSVNENTMVIHGRSKCETLLAATYKMIQIFHYPHLVSWLQQNCPVTTYFEGRVNRVLPFGCLLFQSSTYAPDNKHALSVWCHVHVDRLMESPSVWEVRIMSVVSSSHCHRTISSVLRDSGRNICTHVSKN